MYFTEDDSAIEQDSKKLPKLKGILKNMIPREFYVWPEYLIFLSVFKVSGDFGGNHDLNIPENPLFS